MNIYQVTTTISYGDAIGYHAVSLKRVLAEAGYNTEIYTSRVDERYPSGTARLYSEMPALKKNDIIIHHRSGSVPDYYHPEKWKCRVIMMYQNITPPEFAEPWDPGWANALKKGLTETMTSLSYVERCIAMSEFNKRDLLSMGFPEDKIWVMPSEFIPFEDYSREPDAETIKRYSDDWVNVLFVGRIAPNKMIEDVIRVFAYYKKHINPKSRLILVGSAGFQKYYTSLRAYVNALKISDIIFTNHISFPEIISFYKVADIFLCMSEHEGFCVPLVEAMYFDVPIIAYSSTAIPGTLGGSGICVDTKDPAYISGIIDRIVKTPPLRRKIVAGQQKRLKDFDPGSAKKAFCEYIKSII